MVSAACRQRWPESRPLKILVPLDGSDLSEAALGPARELTQSFGAHLLLMRVTEQVSDLVWGFDPVGVTIHATTEADLDAAQLYLEGIADTSGSLAGSVDVLVDIGDPSSAIASVARQESVNLIIMATHGRTGLARLTMGSVATTTLQRAHVPILLVRPAALPRATREVVDTLPRQILTTAGRH
jgi:nucleotide-binding universal stress UspA family protein